jgi:phosphoheptose isomerase/dTDP-glucose pyrophosphorylase
MLLERVDRYLEEVSRSLMALDRQTIVAVIEQLIRVWSERRQIFLFGNGGSAALASHMAEDLNKLAIPGQPRLRAISLTDSIALITAWANDTSYENVFAEQLKNLCQPGDLVIAVSCSGNSPNVLAALKVAQALGATTVGFTGNQGGQLAEMVDVCVRAPADFIGQQEDIHLALDHMMAATLQAWICEVKERRERPVRALVLAAGAGTRLRPLTADCPKPMVPIDGKPLLEHTLAWLRRHGIAEVAINLHYMPAAIMQHFGNGAHCGVDIRYSFEELPLGTAGALRPLADFLSQGTFVVVYGDVLTDIDLQALLAAHYGHLARDPHTGITISLYRVPNPTEVGLVGLGARGRVLRFVEKPRREEVFTDLANAGIMVVEPRVIPFIPENMYYDFGQHLLPKLLESTVSIYGWEVPPSAYVLDIGTNEKYQQAQTEWPLHYQLQQKDERWAGQASSWIATA